MDESLKKLIKAISDFGIEEGYSMFTPENVESDVDFICDRLTELVTTLYDSK